jgi:hypothetical protein
VLGTTDVAARRMVFARFSNDTLGTTDAVTGTSLPLLSVSGALEGAGAARLTEQVGGAASRLEQVGGVSTLEPVGGITGAIG